MAHGGEPDQAVVLGAGEVVGRVRAALRAEGLSVAGEAESIDEVLSLAKRCRPAVAVLDHSLPGAGGPAVRTGLVKVSPRSRVLSLVPSLEGERLGRDLLVESEGYVRRDASFGEIGMAARAVVSGQTYLAPEIASRLLSWYRCESLGAAAVPRELSGRESAVLRLVAQGRNNSEIAADLMISPKTVKLHVSSILSKLGLRNRTEAAVLAVRRGIEADRATE